MNEIHESPEGGRIKPENQRKRRAKQGKPAVEGAKAQGAKRARSSQGARFRVSADQMDALRNGRSV